MARKKRLTRLLEMVLLIQSQPDWRPGSLRHQRTIGPGLSDRSNLYAIKTRRNWADLRVRP